MAKYSRKLDIHKFKEVMAAKHMNQRQLCLKINVPYSTFRNYIDGLNIPKDTLDKVCELLGIHEDAIISDGDISMKDDMLGELSRIRARIALGEDPIQMHGLWIQAWRAAAPYFLTRPRDDVRKDEAEKERAELRAMLDDIVNVEDDDDGTGHQS